MRRLRCGYLINIPDLTYLDILPSVGTQLSWPPCLVSVGRLTSSGPFLARAVPRGDCVPGDQLSPAVVFLPSAHAAPAARELSARDVFISIHFHPTWVGQSASQTHRSRMLWLSMMW